MTSKELADMLNIKESYMKSNWTRVVNTNLKNGTYLIRIGRGKSAVYGIRFIGDEDIRWEYKE